MYFKFPKRAVNYEERILKIIENVLRREGKVKREAKVKTKTKKTERKAGLLCIYPEGSFAAVKLNMRKGWWSTKRKIKEITSTVQKLLA